KCRITQRVDETTSNSLATTTAYGFDTCGNTNSVAVTGHNPDGSLMTTRTTGTNYGTRCQMPETVTNPANEATTLTNNYTLGVVTQQSDPNSILTKWDHDTFGRVTKVTWPDGTYSTYSLNSCNTPPCWGFTDLRVFVQRTDNAVDATLLGQESFYFDGMERL